LQELHDGLKNITSELPVLEERYQRLLQHFAGMGVEHRGLRQPVGHRAGA
jgi:type I restriction enzyme R subunit